MISFFEILLVEREGIAYVFQNKNNTKKNEINHKKELMA